MAPQFACLFGSRAKVGIDSPVLLPGRKELTEVGLNKWKDVSCSWIERRYHKTTARRVKQCARMRV